MTTYREAIYMCLDLIKGTSDDFTYTEDHVAYLVDKYRALLLKQRYGNDPKKNVPYSNYQTLEVTFDPTERTSNTIKSSNTIPNMLQIGIPRIITPNDEYYNYRYEFTSRERLPFTGNNKYLKMITYCALNDTNNIILLNKESYWNEEGDYIGPTKFSIVGVLENPRENIEDDWLDVNLPIEEGLITTLIDMVVKELLGAAYRPADVVNNSSDDMATMANFLSNVMKKDFNDQIRS